MHKVKNKGRKKSYGGMCGWTKELQLNEEKKNLPVTHRVRHNAGSNLKYSAIMLNRRNEILQTQLENFKYEIRGNYPNTLDKYSRLSSG